MVERTDLIVSPDWNPDIRLIRQIDVFRNVKKMKNNVTGEKITLSGRYHHWYSTIIPRIPLQAHRRKYSRFHTKIVSQFIFPSSIKESHHTIPFKVIKEEEISTIISKRENYRLSDNIHELMDYLVKYQSNMGRFIKDKTEIHQISPKTYKNTSEKAFPDIKIYDDMDMKTGKYRYEYVAGLPFIYKIYFYEVSESLLTYLDSVKDIPPNILPKIEELRRLFIKKNNNVDVDEYITEKAKYLSKLDLSDFVDKMNQETKKRGQKEQ